MKFVLLYGPHAVGKMTVGEELAKTTGLKLFHNHMSIELVLNFFDFSKPQFGKLVNSFRQQIFEEVSKSDLQGLIFTYVWAFNQQSDWNYVNKVCSIFEDVGAEIYLVELETDISTRIDRNKTPHRLECKPSKRNLEWSEQNLLKAAEKHRLNSYDGEITRANYLRIDNTNLSPVETAKLIKDSFRL